MGEIADLASAVYREFATDGVPSSGKHKPVKEDIRTLFETIESAVMSLCATRADMKAISPASVRAVYLAEEGREGVFIWRSGDYAAAVALDAREGIYIKSTAIAASAGAWVRQYEWRTESAWFGAVGDNTADDGPALDAALAMAILEGVGLGYTGSKGSIFKRTTAHLIDMAGAASTRGMIIEGMGNQRSIINVRAASANPQAKIFCSGGFVGAAITAISGTGSTVTVSWANTITSPVGYTLEIKDCSIAGYNGNWTILTSGPGTATFACAATGTPGTLGNATQRVIQANARFVNVGFAGNVNGRVLELASHDFSDQMNRNYYDLTATNDTNAANACGIEINANYHCYGIMNAVLGGAIIGGSAGVRSRKAAFCDFSVGGGNAYAGLQVSDDFTYCTVFRALDSEIVTFGVIIDSAYASQNTFIGGTLGYTTHGAIATGGSLNRFIGVNRNSGQPFFSSDPAYRVGLLLDDGQYIGYNGLTSFGNEYLTGSASNTEILSGETLPAPADGVTRTWIWTTAGAAASLTITLPSSPGSGKHLEFSFVNAVTALTITGGSPVGWSNPTAVPAKTKLEFTYFNGAWWQN